MFGSTGMDAQVAYGFHNLRNEKPYLAQGPIANKVWLVRWWRNFGFLPVIFLLNFISAVSSMYAHIYGGVRSPCLLIFSCSISHLKFWTNAYIFDLAVCLASLCPLVLFIDVVNYVTRILHRPHCINVLHISHMCQSWMWYKNG